MKKIFLGILFLSLTLACNQTVEKSTSNLSDEYASNLKTAQTFFELFLTED